MLIAKRLCVKNGLKKYGYHVKEQPYLFFDEDEYLVLQLNLFSSLHCYTLFKSYLWMEYDKGKLLLRESLILVLILQTGNY